jgi:hypothetical protein
MKYSVKYERHIRELNMKYSTGKKTALEQTENTVKNSDG